jgi:LuxR family maltose regulon positive regulatory protein
MASHRALALLDSVESELGTMVSRSDRESLRGECKALRAVLLAEKGDYEAARVLAEQYLSAPVAQPWVPNAILNVIASAHLHAGRWEQLYVVPPPAGEPNEHRSRDRTSLVYRLCILGLAEYRQGHLDDAARYLEQGIELGAVIGTRGNVLKALPAPTLALVRYEQDRLDEAEQINAEHFEINRRVGPIDGLSGCCRIAARVARMRGQPTRARTLLDDAERIAAARGWNRVTSAVCLEKTRFCLLDGRMSEAAACITRIETLASAVAKPSLEYLDISRDAVLARAWRDIVEGAHDSAARSLEPQLRAARANGKLLDELRVGTSLALAWLSAGRNAEALRLFLSLCRQAQAAGAVRSILDQPVAVDALIRFTIAHAQLAQASTEVLAFMQRLVHAEGELTPRAAVAVADVETLSPREHNILKLISQGLSNKAIARNLGITPETVKSHVKKIFSKLGVQNRAQAAARLA